jgi:hypothetical protein
MSEFVKSGDFFMKEELTKIWDEVNKEYGTDAKLPPSSIW